MKKRHKQKAPSTLRLLGGSEPIIGITVAGRPGSFDYEDEQVAEEEVALGSFDTYTNMALLVKNDYIKFLLPAAGLGL